MNHCANLCSIYNAYVSDAATSLRSLKRLHSDSDAFHGGLLADVLSGSNLEYISVTNPDSNLLGPATLKSTKKLRYIEFCQNKAVFKVKLDISS